VGAPGSIRACHTRRGPGRLSEPSPILLSVDGATPAASVVARCAAVLADGALVIFPTDTLYALGGRALDPAAARRVREVKGRPGGQPLPVVTADKDQARSLCASWPRDADRLAAAFWPGPLTIVLPVAVRVPALAVTTALCAAAGPLISTSANRTGARAPLTCAEAVEGVGAAAAIALDAGPGSPLASTIVDLTGETPALLRAGAVAWADVMAALGLH
jgi:L-threonylcarbamoyladenylate synthase